MKKDDCIFCKIANGEIPSSTVYEDERFRAILDLGPASDGHTIILPKDHFADLIDADTETRAAVMDVAAKIGAGMKKGLGCAGFNVVQNNGEAAGQTVFHLHVHVIPRYENGPQIVAWKPGANTDEERTEILERLTAGITAENK